MEILVNVNKEVRYFLFNSILTFQIHVIKVLPVIRFEIIELYLWKYIQENVQKLCDNCLIIIVKEL